MKKIFTVSLLVFFVSAVTLYASPKDEAKAMVNKAVALYHAKGRDAVLAEVQKKNGQFVKGDVYIYVMTTTLLLAHPMTPSMVGKSFNEIKDAEGKYFIKEALEALKTKNEVWVVYKWNNPVAKKIGTKNAVFKKVDDLIFVCGVWE